MLREDRPESEIRESFLSIEEDLDSEGYLSLTQIEEAEAKLLKPKQTAFHILPNGAIITPLHSSITRIMNIFDFELQSIRPGRMITEAYRSMSRTDGYTALLTYEIRKMNIKLTEVKSGDAINCETDFFVIDPVIEFVPNEGSYHSRYESVNLKDLVKYYPHNSFPDVAMNLVKNVILDISKQSKYVM